MNKRAVTNTIIISIITVLLAFGGIYAFFGKSIQTVKNNTEGLGCRSTLIAQNFTRDKIYMPTFEEECKTLEKTIPMSKKTETKEEVMKEIADLIARTWWSVDEGKIKNLWDKGAYSSGTGYYCFIRYAINFEEEFEITQGEFEKYLLTTHYKTFEGISYTYSSYIYDYGGLGALGILPEIDPQSGDIIHLSNNKIEKGKVYAISVQSPHETHSGIRSGINGIIWLAQLVGVPDSNVLNYVKGNVDDKNTLVIFSTLDFAQKELGCPFI